MELILFNDKGEGVASWSIGTETDYDVNDLDDEGEHDFYVTREDCKRMSYETIGHDIGEEVARQIALAMGWL